MVTDEKIKYQKLKMMADNTYYLNSQTKEAMEAVYGYLLQQYKETGFKKKTTMAELIRKTGVSEYQMWKAVFLLMFMEKPKIKMKADRFKDKNGILRRIRDPISLI